MIGKRRRRTVETQGVIKPGAEVSGGDKLRTQCRGVDSGEVVPRHVRLVTKASRLVVVTLPAIPTILYRRQALRMYVLRPGYHPGRNASSGNGTSPVQVRLGPP